MPDPGKVTNSDEGKDLSKRSFYSWLIKHKDWDDRVGDLARDAKTDETFPRHARTLKRLETYLKSRHACTAAIEARQTAWKEFDRNNEGEAKPSF